MTTRVKITEADMRKWFPLALTEALSPLGIDVSTNFLVMSQPPKGDVLLLRRQGGDWTEEQRGFLPPGIRDSQANHIIIFKCTESIHIDVFLEAAGYHFHYRDTHKIDRCDFELFILSTKTPQKSRLAKWGYQEAEYPGVYRSNYQFFNLFPILVLNELRPLPNNVLVTTVSSQKIAQNPT